MNLESFKYGCREDFSMEDLEPLIRTTDNFAEIADCLAIISLCLGNVHAYRGFKGLELSLRIGNVAFRIGDIF